MYGTFLSTVNAYLTKLDTYVLGVLFYPALHPSSATRPAPVWYIVSYTVPLGTPHTFFCTKSKRIAAHHRHLLYPAARHTHHLTARIQHEPMHTRTHLASTLFLEGWCSVVAAVACCRLPPALPPTTTPRLGRPAFFHHNNQLATCSPKETTSQGSHGVASLLRI